MRRITLALLKPSAAQLRCCRLAAMRPRLHLFGHHHRFSDEVREGVRSVGLDLVTRSYVLLDAASLDVRLMQMG